MKLIAERADHKTNQSVFRICAFHMNIYTKYPNQQNSLNFFLSYTQFMSLFKRHITINGFVGYRIGYTTEISEMKEKLETYPQLKILYQSSYFVYDGTGRDTVMR